jgi:hypothetical protein
MVKEDPEQGCNTPKSRFSPPPKATKTCQLLPRKMCPRMHSFADLIAGI